MVPYFLLIIIPALFAWFSFEKNDNGIRCLKIQSNNQNSIALPLFFLILFLLLALRAESVGRDLPNYKYLFQSHMQQSLSEITSTWKEVLFRLLNHGIGSVTDAFHWYLVIVAVIELVPIAYLYNQDRKKGYIKIILFVNMSTFIMMFSGIRQSMAISFGVLAFCALKNHKKLLFLIMSVLSFFMHNSGFVVLFLYPLYYARIKRKHLAFIIPAFLLVIAFNKPIFLFLTVFISETYEKYGSKISATGAYGSLILLILFAVFSYIITDESQMDDEAVALRNILLMAVFLQCFAPLHSLAMRMNYYFIIFIPLAIGRALETPKKEFYQVARLGEIIMCVFFTVHFLYSTYNSYQTGISTLDTIPYVPFWVE